MSRLAGSGPSRRTLASSGMFPALYEAFYCVRDTNSAVCKGTFAMEKMSAKGVESGYGVMHIMLY